MKIFSLDKAQKTMKLRNMVPPNFKLCGSQIAPKTHQNSMGNTQLMKFGLDSHNSMSNLQVKIKSNLNKEKSRNEWKVVKSMYFNRDMLKSV